MVIEVDAAVRNCETAGVVRLVIGEARVANVAGVFLVQLEVHLAHIGVVRFPEGSRALLVRGQVQSGGVAGEHGQRVRPRIRVVLVLREEKDAIFLDRPTEREGRVPPGFTWVRGRERRTRLPTLRAIEEEPGAMILIRSGFQNDVHLPAGGAAELRRISAGEHLYFFDGFRRRNHHTNLARTAPLRVVETVKIPAGTLIAAKRELRGAERGTGKPLDARRQ